MKKQADVGERVANFRALIKTEAAHHAMANAHPAQDFLKRARLRTSAVKDSGLGIGILAQEGGNLAANKFRLSGRILSLEKAHQVPRADVSLEILAQAIGIVGDNSGSGIEDGLRGAVILFQPDDLRSGEILGKALQIAGARPAPAVDRLVLVADDTHVLARAGQKAYQLFLRRIGILKLIDH